MKLHAGISKQYKRTFLLDEDGLRRINSVLEEDASKHGSGYIKYTVKREDDRFYDTDSVDDVLQDPNVFKQRITELTVYLIEENQVDSSHKEPDWLCRLFYKKNTDREDIPIFLNIKSTNLQRALILSDKLEPQILRNTKRIVGENIIIWLGLILFITLALALPLKKFSGIDPSAWLPIVMPVIFIIFILCIFAPIFPEKLGWLFPVSSFLWGDEIAAHQIRVSRRRNWLWGVIIAFAVSLIAGISSGVLMKDRTNKIKADKDIEMSLQKKDIEMLKKEIEELKKNK